MFKVQAIPTGSSHSPSKNTRMQWPSGWSSEFPLDNSHTHTTHASVLHMQAHSQLHMNVVYTHNTLIKKAYPSCIMHTDRQHQLMGSTLGMHIQIHILCTQRLYMQEYNEQMVTCALQPVGGAFPIELPGCVSWKTRMTAYLIVKGRHENYFLSRYSPQRNFPYLKHLAVICSWHEKALLQ